jgi:mutator protein MutT
MRRNPVAQCLRRFEPCRPHFFKMKNNEFRIAVKAVIVKAGRILLIKRSHHDTHKPGVWEFPGGRLEPGEDPLKGLIREVKEETGLIIEVLYPLKVVQFKRDDGQKITMITFLCKPKTLKLNLSHEHTFAEWVGIKKARAQIYPKFREELNIYEKYFKD